MTRHLGKRSKPKKLKSKFQKNSIQYLLEQGTLHDMREARKINNAHVKYYWDYYSELATQRNAIQDQIKQALIQTCIPYAIEKWQRALKYKYSLHPLSIAGSLTFIGGRFNTGRGVNSEIPTFAGLYLAKNKDTALQEHLGQEPVSDESKLTPREIALTNPASETIISISGKLDKIFDLTGLNSLHPFIELIKNFVLSPELKSAAKKLQIQQPEIIKTSDKLLETLLCTRWRQLPSEYDVPANSQIFGHLVYSAGIEGILYPSKLTTQPCLVIFPENFSGTDSYLVLDDETPHPKVPNKVDGSNWRICELNAKEIIEY